jgi:site-specific DNA recombinase
MRAALYARVSTEEQAQKYGLDSQLRELRALAERKGYFISPGAEFVDESYSGATLDRPALTKLRDAIRTGAIDVVLIYDPDRLSRQLAHQLLLIDEIEACRVAIEWASGPRGNTTEGRLLDNVRGVIAEFEREKIRERTGRGRKEKARRGFFIASRAPFGYCFGPDGKLAVHEEEASVVRMMFRWLVDEQRSARSIVIELRRLGIRPQRGAAWAKSSVTRILTSRLYFGEGYFNQREVIVNPRTGRKTLHRWRPREEWIAIPVPAIVTSALFEAAQQQLARNRSVLVGRPNRVPYLLRGLLRCGRCQRAWTAEMAHGRRTYRCSGRSGLMVGGRCRGGSISAVRIEQTVWKATERVLRDPAMLMEKLTRAADALNVSATEVRSQVDHLRRQLAETAKQEQRILDLFLDDRLRTDAVRGRLEHLGRRRATVGEQLARAEALVASRDAVEAQQDAIARQCAQVLRGIDRLTLEGRQTLLRSLVDQVVIRGRELEIHGILLSVESTTPAEHCVHRRPRSRARAWRAPARARRRGRGRRKRWAPPAAPEVTTTARR